MSSSWRRDDLPQLVAALAGRPGHERLRTLIAEILRHGFGAEYLALDHEVRLPEVRGRADLLFGATVFELKRDLRRELGDAQTQLPDYLGERERRTGRRYLGIATDGATFVAYELRDGALAEIGRFATRTSEPEALLAWLEPALSNRDDLVPDPLVVQRELGRESLTFGRARRALEALWTRLAAHPEVRVKRELWDGLLRDSYGDAVGDDALFLQHTYLTVVAKTLPPASSTCRPRTPRRSCPAKPSPRPASTVPSRATSSIGCCLRRTATTSCGGSRGRFRVSG